MTDLRKLRQQIRALRRTLSDDQRKQASNAICQRILELQTFSRAQHVATFLAFEGEPDIESIIRHATGLEKTIYLPVLLAKQQPMLFAPYQPGDRLKANWFNIPEPDVPRTRMITPVELDLVLTPLVAFDEQANRLGVGGGFYDRSFAFINDNTTTDRPDLLGVAFELQKVDILPRREWDVPLDGIATESRLYAGKNGELLE